MKIAHVVASLPPDIGGMGRVAFDEAVGSSQHGDEVTVFTLSYFPHQYDDSSLPFRVVRANPLIRSGIAGMVPGWRKQFDNFDIIHLHYPFYGGSEWVWSSGKKYVVTYHMDASPTIKRHRVIKNIYDRILAKRILQKAKRVILVDERHYLSERKILFPDQSIVIKNGVDINTFKPTNVRREDLGLDTSVGRTLFLFVGNLLPIKGLSKLLKAWKNVSNDKMHLAILGSGFHEHEFRAEANELGIVNITWLGACHDQNKMVQFYSASDAVIIPSISESFSLVAAEALACGKPVLASRLPGLLEKVIEGKTGFTFEPGNEKEIEKCLNAFMKLDQSKRESVGNNGVSLIREKFSMQQHMDILNQLYKEVV